MHFAPFLSLAQWQKSYFTGRGEFITIFVPRCRVQENKQKKTRKGRKGKEIRKVVEDISVTVAPASVPSSRAYRHAADRSVNGSKLSLTLRKCSMTVENLRQRTRCPSH